MNWRRIRSIINKDDGKHFQVGNHDITILKGLSMLLVVAALICFQLHHLTHERHYLWAAAIFAGTFVIALGGSVRQQMKRAPREEKNEAT